MDITGQGIRAGLITFTGWRPDRKATRRIQFVDYRAVFDARAVGVSNYELAEIERSLALRLHEHLSISDD